MQSKFEMDRKVPLVALDFLHNNPDIYKLPIVYFGLLQKLIPKSHASYDLGGCGDHAGAVYHTCKHTPPLSPTTYTTGK